MEDGMHLITLAGRDLDRALAFLPGGAQVGVACVVGAEITGDLWSLAAPMILRPTTARIARLRLRGVRPEGHPAVIHALGFLVKSPALRCPSADSDADS